MGFYGWNYVRGFKEHGYGCSDDVKASTLVNWPPREHGGAFVPEQFEWPLASSNHTTPPTIRDRDLFGLNFHKSGFPSMVKPQLVRLIVGQNRSTVQCA